MGKMENGIYFCVTADILKKKFYRNVSGVVLYQPSEFCPNRWFWLVAMATERLIFRRKRKNSKIYFSDAIRGMKLKLCINVHDYWPIYMTLGILWWAGVEWTTPLNHWINHRLEIKMYFKNRWQNIPINLTRKLIDSFYWPVKMT